MATPDGDIADVYLALRGKILELDPESVGLEPTPQLRRVYGLVMESGQPGAVVTFVGLSDGTTSLYFSNGGGIIGAGEHAPVADATLAMLRVIERYLDRMPRDADRTLPASGRVVLRALTYRDGPHAIEADEDDLGYGRHELSEVFHAVHAAITAVRE